MNTHDLIRRLGTLPTRPVLLCWFLCLLVLLCTVDAARSQQTDTLWHESWEGNWTADWHAEGGTWEVGTIASGPDTSYTGIQAAATVLAGDYADDVDARLIRHTWFVVPAAEEQPRLRFWHWYSFAANDAGHVQVRTEDGEWESVSEALTHTSSGVWTRTYYDLSDYAGQQIQVAFLLQTRRDQFSRTYTSSGWYLDDIVIEGRTSVAVDDTGPPIVFRLHGVYPNPVTLATTLRFDLAHAADVTVRVYDALGREVRRLDAGRLSGGRNHELRLAAAGLASGLYLYQMTVSSRGHHEARTGTFALMR